MNGWVLLGWLRFASLRFAPLRFASLRVEPHGPAVDRLASPWEPTDCLTFVFLVCSKNENIEILPTVPGVGSNVRRLPDDICVLPLSNLGWSFR